MGAASDLLSGKIASNLPSGITDFVKDMSCILLGLLDHRHGCPSARRSASFVSYLKFRILHSNLVLGEFVELHQALNLEFIDVNTVCVGPEMETYGNELNDDLLHEVQNSTDEKGDDDLVDGHLPFFCRFAAIHMVACHSGEERDLNGQQPEKEGCRDFEGLPEIPPLLAIVGKDAREQTHGIRNALGYDLQLVSKVISTCSRGLTLPAHSVSQRISSQIPNQASLTPPTLAVLYMRKPSRTGTSRSNVGGVM